MRLLKHFSSTLPVHQVAKREGGAKTSSSPLWFWELERKEWCRQGGRKFSLLLPPIPQTQHYHTFKLP